MSGENRWRRLEDGVHPAILRENFQKFIANFIAVKDFDAHNLTFDYIKNYHAFSRTKRHVSVVGLIAVPAAFVHIHRRAEIIPAPTTVQDIQTGDLLGKRSFPFVSKKHL